MLRLLSNENQKASHSQQAQLGRLDSFITKQLRMDSEPLTTDAVEKVGMVDVVFSCATEMRQRAFHLNHGLLRG
jgi:hypothetical protein